MNGTNLGAGIVYWPELDPLIESRPGLFQVLEIEIESFWKASGTDEASYRLDEVVLKRLNAFPQPKVVHGVGFPVGTCRPPSDVPIALFQKSIQALNAVWASEHLSFNRARCSEDIFATGFLLPPLQTEAGRDAIVTSIKHVANRLTVPFIFETGVNYLRPHVGEIPDGEFIATTATRADCGILLDLHNLWTNEQNGRQSIEEFLRALPLERVWEVHLAGGEELDGYWLDAHSGAIPGPLLDITRRLLPHLTNCRALVFEIMPVYVDRFGLDQVAVQMEMLQRIWQDRTKSTTSIGFTIHDVPQTTSRPKCDAVAFPSITPAEWEDALGSVVVGIVPKTTAERALVDDPGIPLFRKLIREFRASMVVLGLRLSCRLIRLTKGKAYLEDHLLEYWDHTPPQLFSSQESSAFGRYLLVQTLDIPHLEEVLLFELALLDVNATGKARVVSFSCEPMSLLRALGENRMPDFKTKGSFELEITPDILD